MKIIKKNNATPTKKEENHTLQTIKNSTVPVLTCIGMIAAFALIYSMLTMYASPDKFTTTDVIDQSLVTWDTAGGTYIGPVHGITYNGDGQFQYLDGGTYTGSFADSERAGEGTFVWPNGDTYTGTWEDDNMSEGTYTFANGETFKGSFEDNQFATGQISLTGDALSKSGFTSFSCGYTNNAITTYSFVYKGLTYSGDLTGSANIKYANGDTYSGGVSNGVPSGNGQYTWASGNASYNGGWQNGKMNGTGTYDFSANTYPYITGTFKDGKPTGTAVYYKEAGNTFDTQWSNGKCVKVTET